MRRRVGCRSTTALLGVLILMSLMALPALPAVAATHDSGSVAPGLMLANSWRPGLPLSDFWVSEKYDGVRGYWDGTTLWTRRGGRIVAPAWFTAGWPNEPMDGELWAGRGRFEFAQSTVAVNVPVDSSWDRMRFMVFDLPGRPEAFDVRKDALVALVHTADVRWLNVVDQTRVLTPADLQARLRRVMADGGEGLVLHRGSSLYRGERNDDLLKLKLHDDAEATVVAALAGKGRYAGQMGALLVETPGGVRFRLGSGFSDAERQAPPAIGTVVTYRFRGMNKNGVPRFATFMRARLL